MCVCVCVKEALSSILGFNPEKTVFHTSSLLVELPKRLLPLRRGGFCVDKRRKSGTGPFSLLCWCLTRSIQRSLAPPVWPARSVHSYERGAANTSDDIVEGKSTPLVPRRQRSNYPIPPRWRPDPRKPRHCDRHRHHRPYPERGKTQRTG